MTTNTNAALLANLWEAIGYHSAQVRETGHCAPGDGLISAMDAVKAALSTAAQPPAGYEHQRALMEGERNDSLRIYIEQANGSSTPRSERAYETGFTNGWNRALAAAPKPRVQIPPENVHFDSDVSRKAEKVDTSAAPKAERAPLTERQIVKCLVEASCVGTVKMSFESGPYDIDRPSINATRLVDAIEREHGIQTAHKEQP